MRPARATTEIRPAGAPLRERGTYFGRYFSNRRDDRVRGLICRCRHCPARPAITGPTLHPPDRMLAAVSLDLAERPARLRGLRIGLLDNGRDFSGEVLAGAAEALRRAHGTGEVRVWRRRLPGWDAALLAAMAAACDAAVIGVGQCGASAPSSVRDAIALERRGVPTATLIGRAFCPLARAVAQRRAFPALPIVMLADPVGDREPARIHAKGGEAAAEIARLLTAPRAIVVQEFIAKIFPPPDRATAGR